MRPLPVLQPDQVETFGTELEHLDWIAYEDEELESLRGLPDFEALFESD